MPLLDQMAATGHLSWFVDRFVDAYYEDENEKALWDVWLHKVWESKSFGDFKREHRQATINQMKNEYIRDHPQEVAKTVEKSRGIIEQFSNPVEMK